MFETLKRMYIEGKLRDSELQKAVQKRWISLEQYNQIINVGETETK